MARNPARLKGREAWVGMGFPAGMIVYPPGALG